MQNTTGKNKLLIRDPYVYSFRGRENFKVNFMLFVTLLLKKGHFTLQTICSISICLSSVNDHIIYFSNESC